MKYARYLKFTIGNVPIENEYYSEGNIEKVVGVLQEISADVVILQEFYHPSDVTRIQTKLRYAHHLLVDAWYHKHSIAVIANADIEIVDGTREFTILTVNDNYIVPIHLNSFSPEKRFGQVKILSEIIKEYGKVIIAGDTNFWIIGKRFLSNTDRRSYELLTNYTSDTSAGLATTYFGTSMDKIFITEHCSVRSKVVRERGAYMDHYPIYAEIS
ncbi:MAG: endonuclease/exonuclease/phosphatase family protein [Candidatus Jorgensenbacteria bacterium]